MKNPARPRAKAVKTREGNKSTIQAAPTLEEYRAAEEAAMGEGASPDKAAPDQPSTPDKDRTPASPPASSGLVRSSGKRLPQTRCSRCGKLAHEHPVRAVYGVSDSCPRLVVFRDDEGGPADETTDDWRDDDEYDDLGYYGEDDEAPSWLAAAGISREEWDAEERARGEARARAREQRQLEAETKALTEQWRSEVADKPADPRRSKRR